MSDMRKEKNQRRLQRFEVSSKLDEKPSNYLHIIHEIMLDRKEFILLGDSLWNI